MARFRSGNAIQSKIQMILFGNPFTGKSTMALQSAYLKNPDGSPFKVLYLDPESGSVDDYLPTLAENGVDMRNILIAYTQSITEVWSLLNGPRMVRIFTFQTMMEMKQTKYISTVTGSPSDRI